MEDFQQQVEQIRQAAEAALAAKESSAHAKQQETDQLEQELAPLFESISREFLQEDDRLDVQDLPDGSPGFVINLTTKQKTFKLTVSAVGNGKELTLTVADGKWEEVYGQMGNWVHWTDQKQVYSGPLDERRIRRCLQKQFLSWYQNVLEAPIQ